MKRRHKVYLKLNLVSLVFIVVSFISVTLAWFAYSGLVDVGTEIDVKAWHIKVEKDGVPYFNDITVSFPNIYPGMDTVKEVISIKNLGDSDAAIKYAIVSARLLDNAEDNYKVDGENIKSEYVEDILSHEYPFHVNINLTKGYALSNGGESSFEVSVSWPLDSGDDALDSEWGARAYEYQKSANLEPAIQIIISVIAEQYIAGDTISDPNYNLGDTVLFDVVSNSLCTEISSTCLETYIIDVNNSLGDETITLLPKPNNTYGSGVFNNYDLILEDITTDWIANTRSLLVTDLLKAISTDVKNSVLIRDGISDMIIGNLKYENRMNNEINKAVSDNGYYKFINEKFSYISASNCYWTASEYDTGKGFAVVQINGNTSRIYGEAKGATCNVVPVIVVNKSDL